jgi:hypothetical protein
VAGGIRLSFIFVYSEKVCGGVILFVAASLS